MIAEAGAACSSISFDFVDAVGDGKGTYLDQADSQATVPATHTFFEPDGVESTPDAGIVWDVGVDVLGTHRTLNLETLANKIEGKGGGLGNYTGHDTCNRIARAEWHLTSTENLMEEFIAGEEQTHIGHNCSHSGRETAEVAKVTLMS